MTRINGVAGLSSADAAEACVASMRAAIGTDSPSVSFAQEGRAASLSAGQLASTPAADVAFDGWIYNRTEKGAQGNDARAFLSLFEEYGIEGALERINGDFALALYDKASGALVLARDRFGLKPLYYCEFHDGWAFSSRLRGLLALAGVSRAVNRQFVGLYAGSHYRMFDNAPEQSPFEAIRQLPAAHYLLLPDGRAQLRRYWAPRDEPEFDVPEAELVEQYRELVLDAVSLRLARAQRPAFTLSGGMDSSSVLASAVRSSGQQYTAISTVYVDRTFDETEEIRSMLDSQVEKWIPVEVGDPDLFNLLPEIIDRHDEPVATATWLSHYLLCREASRQGFGSLFGGLGGDELNAGEYEHFFYFFADLRAAGLEQRYTDEVRMWAHYHDHPVFKKDRGVAEAQLARVVELSRPGVCLPDRARIDRYIAALNPEYFDLSAFTPAMDHPFRSYLKNRTYQDLVRETVPCCLRAEDRQTAAFGMDNFLPFFDHRLVEFMFRVPSTLKYRSGVTKSLLREAMRGILPEETRTRVKKTGWNAPAHRWFSGPGRVQLFDLVHSLRFRERGIYNLTEVLRLLDEHEDIITQGLQRDNHMMFFWQLVNLEFWLRWVDRLAPVR